MIDIKRIAVLAVTVGAVVALAGCGIIQDKVDDAVQDGVENAIEEGAGDDVDVEFGEDASLPDGFPADVPLPDGSVVASIGGEDGYFVTFSVADAADVDALFAAYEDGGWELVGDFSTDDSQSRAYKNDAFEVGIAALATDSDVQISMSVVPVTS